MRCFDNSFISLTLTCRFLHDKDLLLGWHCLIGLARKKLAEPFHQQHLSGTCISLQALCQLPLLQIVNECLALPTHCSTSFADFKWTNRYFWMTFTWKWTKMSFQPELEREKYLLWQIYIQGIVCMYACVCIWWKKKPLITFQHF